MELLPLLLHARYDTFTVRDHKGIQTPVLTKCQTGTTSTQKLQDGGSYRSVDGDSSLVGS